MGVNVDRVVIGAGIGGIAMGLSLPTFIPYWIACFSFSYDSLAGGLASSKIFTASASLMYEALIDCAPAMYPPKSLPAFKRVL